MSTTINVKTNVSSMAPITTQATTFFPTFCLLPLAICYPSCSGSVISVIVIIVFGLCGLEITAVTYDQC